MKELSPRAIEELSADEYLAYLKSKNVPVTNVTGYVDQPQRPSLRERSIAAEVAGPKPKTEQEKLVEYYANEHQKELDAEAARKQAEIDRRNEKARAEQQEKERLRKKWEMQAADEARKEIFQRYGLTALEIATVHQGMLPSDFFDVLGTKAEMLADRIVAGRS